MSNATTKTAGRPSRRSLLAAGPAVAILSTVNTAMAEGPDPIFAALEEARRTRASYDQARAPMLAARREHPELPSFFTFAAKADGESEKVATIQHLNDWLGRQGPARAVEYKRSFAASAARVLGIEEPAVADPSPEALAAWEAERSAVVAEFERARQAYDDAEAKAFPAYFHDVVHKAAHASQAAEDALLATVPTTAAGGVALLRFCLEAMERYADHRQVMPAMQNALAAMEGARAT